MKLKGLEQLWKQSSVRNWTSELKQKNLEQPGYQGSIHNRIAEGENKTAEAETERFQQLCKQSNTKLKCRNGNWTAGLKLEILEQLQSGEISETEQQKTEAESFRTTV